MTSRFFRDPFTGYKDLEKGLSLLFVNLLNEWLCEANWSQQWSCLYSEKKKMLAAD